jgi:hypothetical protein
MKERAMLRVLAGTVLSLLMVLAGRPALAEPIHVRFSEGTMRGFPVLRSLTGDTLAQGELIQVARGDLVESRLVFNFGDGSLYDERFVFSQRDMFTLQSYQIVQRGPSFPETIEARVDRATERYEVHYRADDDSPPENLTGTFAMPGDVYNGLLSTLMKNLPAGGSATVQIVAFTPMPRLGGEAPAFIRFEGPLYFMGPVWRIDWG